MMTVIITADTFVKGVPAAKDSVVMLDDAEARALIACQKAAPYDVPASAPEDDDEVLDNLGAQKASADNDKRKRRNR